MSERSDISKRCDMHDIVWSVVCLHHTRAFGIPGSKLNDVDSCMVDIHPNNVENQTKLSVNMTFVYSKST